MPDESALAKKGYVLESEDGTAYHLQPSGSVSGRITVAHAETSKSVGFIVPNRNSTVYSVPDHYTWKS